MTSPIPETIVRSLLSPLGVTSVSPVRPGMSGALVARCQLEGGQTVALKRWPSGTSRSRIEEVHRVVTHAATHGCDFVPKLHVIPSPETVRNMSDHSDGGRRTILADGKLFWELAQWMPGAPASLCSAATESSPTAVADSLDEIRRGAAAIAQFHASVEPICVQFQIAPAVKSRLARLAEVGSLLPVACDWNRWNSIDPALAAALHDAVQLVRWKWDEVRVTIHRSLSQYLDRKVRTQYVLRDVHRDHVLFTGGRVSGLIDFDAIRVDTPATDLSRWVGSFLAEHPNADSVWQAALAGLRSKSASKDGSEMEFEIALAQHLCFANTWLSLSNWLVWLICDQREFPAGPKIVAARIRNLVRTASLET